MKLKEVYETSKETSRIWEQRKEEIQTDIYNTLSEGGERVFVWFFSVLRSGIQYQISIGHRWSRPVRRYRLVVPWEHAGTPVRDLDWSDVDNDENYSWSGSTKRFMLKGKCPMEIA